MTDEQPPLFDVEAGNAAMAEGMRRVERHADPEWKHRAYAAGVYLSRNRDEFTADDFWALVEKPREPRALGPVLRRLVKDGHCEATGEIRRSLIPVHHRAPVRVYRAVYPRAPSTAVALTPENRDNPPALAIPDDS